MASEVTVSNRQTGLAPRMSTHVGVYSCAEAVEVDMLAFELGWGAGAKKRYGIGVWA